MMQFGFQRLALLNSANYKQAMLPLDASVSLVAPNNHGKTSLINALQFMLIIDQRRMDFGSHEFSKTKQFYFPSNSSYILLEISLPQTGTVVFGCVGKGLSHDYEYFAYKGELKLDDYRQADGNMVAQPQLLEHLAQLGKLAYRYDSTEFARLIYGGQSSKRKGNEPDFTVFKLEHVSDAKVFQQVLTRTLRLDKLNSHNVKDYLLQIFKRDLEDANIDFKEEWEKAFAGVNEDRKQYEATKAQLPIIEQMEQAVNERLNLRGKLLAWRPHIDEGLAQWQNYYQNQQAKQQALIEEKDQQKARFFDDMSAWLNERNQLKIQLDKLAVEQQRQDELQNRYALVASRHALERELHICQTELEQITATLQQAEGRSLKVLQNEQSKLLQQHQHLKNQLANLGNHLFQQLSQILGSQELAKLNRLFSDEALVLTPQQFTLGATQLKQWLAQHDEHELELPGLSLKLAGLPAHHQEKTQAELTDELADNERQQSSLVKQIEAAQSWEQSQARKRALEQELKRCEQALSEYDELQTLLANGDERGQKTELLSAQLQELTDKIQHAQDYAKQLDAELSQLNEQQRTLEQQHRHISQLRDTRLDLQPSFQPLEDLPHTPWFKEENWALNELAQHLQHYQEGCQRLLNLDKELRAALALVHAAGLTRYAYSDSPDEELRRIIDYSHQLEQEREALERKARSAVVNVSLGLRTLHHGLLEFQKRIREFNQLIGGRQLSDLKTFKVEALEETHLVEAITILLDKAQTVGSGESFELFNQASVLDDDTLNRAKQRLIEEGEARGGLKVADLFRLQFIVAKAAQPPEAFEDIDSAASNGTVLMAKLVTGLAMLYLMQDKRHKLSAVCYLDEALALDNRNQTNLIATAQEFGYALIFASPAPLITARYTVTVQQKADANYIMEKSWHIIEPLEPRA